MKLDTRLCEDLKELLDGKDISAAQQLVKIIKPKEATSRLHRFSTKGLPCYYYGKREAETVVVNLNPGVKAEVCDEKWSEVSEDRKRLPIDNFIGLYHQDQREFGKNDADRYDEFDIKLAAFLTAWENSGIRLASNPDWTDKAYCKYAKTEVLSNKLQLELIPYASAKFAIDTKHIDLLFPYVDTLLEEIFSCDRKYIIFASAIFESIFKLYNKWDERKGSFKLFEPHSFALKNRNGNCRVLEINYNGDTYYALIANTFPSQSLCKAFSLMQKYGAECYLEYVNKTSK